MSEDSPTPETILRCWFDLPHKNERDDDRVRKQLGPHYHRAVAGEYEHWRGSDKGRLALILLYDQVPRHLFRNEPRQYDTDERARELASVFFEEGFPDQFDPAEVFYAALPYLHAEDPELQRKVNPVIHECAEQLDELGFMGEVADRYLRTIERFGRFPHRNNILGRDTTPEETRWLEENN